MTTTGDSDTAAPPAGTASADTDAAGVPLRRLHLFSVLLQWVASLARSVIPLFVLFMRPREQGGYVLPILGGGILLTTAVWSVLSYLATRYGVTDEALVLRSGVLRRQSRIIPFGRIQSVDVRQSALQRLFGMAELRVETATQGKDAEAALRVLSWRDAQALRERLVAERRSALTTRSAERTGERIASTTDRDTTAPAETSAPVAEPIATLDVEELMVAGGTSNNIGVLIAVLVSGCERFGSSFFERLRMPDHIDGPISALVSAMGNVSLLLVLLLVIVIPILFASWLVSVAGAVVRWYGFTLERVGSDLRRRHGLFSRVEASVPMARAQAIRFRQSMLRRPFRRGELLLVSAGSSGGADGASGGVQHLMPIVRDDRVASLVSVVFPDADVAEPLAAGRRDTTWRRAAPLSWLRLAFDSTIWLVAITGALVLWRGADWWALLWLLPAAWLLAGARWRARGLAMVPGYLLVREGGLARTTVIVPERKLQLIELRQGPLQRRFGVATLQFTTAGAGGHARMVDLPLEQARALRDMLAARLPKTTVHSPVRSPSSSRSPAHAR